MVDFKNCLKKPHRLGGIFLRNVVITRYIVDWEALKADTLRVYLSNRFVGLDQKSGSLKLNLTQGAIYGWWKVKHHLHTD